MDSNVRLRTVPILAAALVGQPALSQQQASDDDIIEEVIVVGIRGSLSQSIEIKRESMQIVDSIVAEDIGKLPDYNVAESLQRVSGIQVTDRASGESNVVSIRGLTDASTLVNGRTIFTASDRAVALADIPSTLLSRLDVYKSRSAQHFENGLAGQVDIHTFRPFDFDGTRVALNARAIHQDQADETDPSVSALFSTRWENGMGKFGALLNVSHTETNFRDQSITAGAQVPFMTTSPAPGFTPLERIFPSDGRVAEDPIWQPGLDAGLPTDAGSTLTVNGVPTEYYLSRDAVFASDFTGERQRPAANLSLQFAPDDRSRYTLEAFYNGYRNETFNSLLFSFVDWWGALGPDPASTFDLYEGTNVIRSRTVGAPFLFGSGDFTDEKTDSYLYALGGEWDFTDRFRLKSEVVYQDSEFESEFLALRTTDVKHQVTTDFSGIPNLTFADNPDTPDVDESNLADPGQWAMAELFNNGFVGSGDSVTLTADAEFDADWGIINRVNFGIRYDDREVSERERDQDAPPCAVVNPDAGADCELSNYPGLEHVNSGFYDGKTDVAERWLVGDGPFLEDNATEFLNLYGLDPNQSLVRTFSITEKNTAVYATANFETEIGGRVLDGEVGFRYVDIDTDMVFIDEQTLDQSEDSNSVSELLTDVMFRYHLTENMLIRFSYGETLRSPDFVDLNANINFLDDVTDIGFGTAEGGNPSLVPTESQNIDLTFEWYFAPASSFYVALFEKDIEGLVVPFRNRIVRDLPGFSTDTFILEQPDNASDGKLEGVEVGFIYFPGNLPDVLDGLGVQSSATFLDSEQTIPITDIEGNVVGSDKTEVFGVSDKSYSVTLAYDRPRFDARLSYVWRDDFLNNNEAPLFANPIGIYRDAEESLDFQFSYNATDNLVLTFDARNLTEEIFQSRYGNSPLHGFGSSLYSRTFALGVRYTLDR